MLQRWRVVHAISLWLALVYLLALKITIQFCEGLLLLTVPIGPDVVVWNLHRRYGKWLQN